MLELVPLGHDHQGVSPRRQLVCILRVLELRQDRLRALHGGWVVGAHMSPRGDQDPGDVEARRLAKVVGVGLEREAE